MFWELTLEGMLSMMQKVFEAKKYFWTRA